MSKFYTEEMKKYIADNCKGKTILDLQIDSIQILHIKR